MGNTKLIFTVCLLSILAVSAGLYTGETLLHYIGLTTLFILSAALSAAYLGVISWANDAMDDIATRDDWERLSKSKIAMERPSTFSELAIFTAAGFLCLFTDSYITPAFVLVTLVMFWLMSKRLKAAFKTLDDSSLRAPEKTTTLKAAAASGAATLATSQTQADPIQDPFNPLNPVNMMHQASVADSLSVHATNNDSTCYTPDTSSSYSSSSSSDCSSSSSYSSSDSGGSSSW